MTAHTTIAATAMAAALVALGGCSPASETSNTTTTSTTVLNETPAAPAADPTAANAASTADTATAELKTADGKPAGTATATEVGGAVQVTLAAAALPPGVHGAHVHTTGKCDAPKFETAGGHWNPAARQHGSKNPEGPHAGDFPNLTVQSDGTGTLTMKLPAGTMAGLLDADGAAFVVHAKPDDNRTDPSGNSGDRIACGVFIAG